MTVSTQCSKKLLIFDRDGTLTEAATGAEFPQHPHDFQLLPGIREAIAHYKRGGWSMAIASNQMGVSLGYLSLEDCIEGMRFCLSLTGLKKAVFCPDKGTSFVIVREVINSSDESYYKVSYSDALLLEEYGNFRKPGPGMLKYLLWRKRADVGLMVGDRQSDADAASAAGVEFEWSDDFRGRFLR